MERSSIHSAYISRGMLIIVIGQSASEIGHFLSFFHSFCQQILLFATGMDREGKLPTPTGLGKLGPNWGFPLQKA